MRSTLRKLLAMGKGGAMLLPAPTNLAGSGNTSAITLTWTDPVWPSSETCAGINLYQSIDGVWTGIAVGAGDIDVGAQTAVVETNLVAGANYFYVQGTATNGAVGAKASITVLPVTRAATVMPARMASGKFHGGITTPTPSGR